MDDGQAASPEKKAEDTQAPPPTVAEIDRATGSGEADPATRGVEKTRVEGFEEHAPEREAATTGVAPPQPAKDDAAAEAGKSIETMCSTVESAAATYGLPAGFFARVIWQESRFQPTAVGPVTRSGHRALGIAQFMPYTAAERGLLDPFSPHAALSEAAEFLAELRKEFGNLGLAAAAYNAGPGRVRGHLAGVGGMPAQTRHYVRTITGRPIEHWIARGREGEKDEMTNTATCRQLAALLKEQPKLVTPDREAREAALRAVEASERQRASNSDNGASRVAADPKENAIARATDSAPARSAASSSGETRKASGKTAETSSSRAKLDQPARAVKRPVTVAAAASEPKPARSSVVAAKGASPKANAMPALKRGVNSAQQNSKPPQVRTASSTSGNNLQKKSLPPLAKSIASRTTPAKTEKSTTVASLTPSERAPSKQGRAGAVAPERKLRDDPAKRVSTHGQKVSAERDPSTGRAGSLSAKRAPSDVAEKKKEASNHVRLEAVLKANDERLKKIMQICRGC